MKSLERTIEKWADRKNRNENPIDFLRKNYPQDISRTELSLQDSGLYQFIRRHGLLEHILLKKVRGVHFENPLAYYLEHYKGMTRGKLQRENKPLYNKMYREGLLNYVPKAKKGKRQERIHKKIPCYRRIPDLVAYYKEHYSEYARGELPPWLYQRLWKAGLLEHIPTKKQLRTQTSWSLN